MSINSNIKKREMKKSYLMIAAAAMAMAACTNDNVLTDIQEGNESQKAITFSSFSEKLTKADPTTNDLEFYHNTFAVYASKKSTVDASGDPQYPFGAPAAAGAEVNGTKVTYASGDTKPNEWTYSPYRFWDKQATYYFCAYAPESAPIRLKYNTATSEVNDAANDFVISTAYELKGQNLQAAGATEAEILTGFDNADENDCDLMIANVVYEEGASHSDEVTFDFKHILAKFNVTAIKADVLDNAVVKIQSIKIESLNNKGTFSNNAYDGGTYTTGWANIARTDGYTLSYAAADGTEINDWSTANKLYFIESLVMPQVIADGQCKITVVYTITTGTGADAYTEKYIRTLDLQDAFTSFFDRYNYTLNLKISADVIKFDASVSAWADYSKDITIE